MLGDREDPTSGKQSDQGVDPSSLSNRLRATVRLTTEETGRFRQLSSDSGIRDASWRAWWYGRQRPTAEMIEAVCRKNPEFALWVATGMDAPELGQESPISPKADSITLHKMPELSRVKAYLQLRVAAIKDSSDNTRRMVQANKKLVASELKFLIEESGYPEDDVFF